MDYDSIGFVVVCVTIVVVMLIFSVIFMMNSENRKCLDEDLTFDRWDRFVYFIALIFLLSMVSFLMFPGGEYLIVVGTLVVIMFITILRIKQIDDEYYIPKMEAGTLASYEHNKNVYDHIVCQRAEDGHLFCIKV